MEGKGVFSLILGIILLMFLTSCGCRHEWKDATCMEPKTCTKCGKTEGNNLGGHEWKDATCMEPKTCTKCGKTEGNNLGGHEWKDATCVEPKTCTECGETEGNSLGPVGHKFGVGKTIVMPTCTEKGVREVVCSVCGGKITETISAKHQYKDGYCVVCFAEDPELVAIKSKIKGTWELDEQGRQVLAGFLLSAQGIDETNVQYKYLYQTVVEYIEVMYIIRIEIDEDEYRYSFWERNIPGVDYSGSVTTHKYLIDVDKRVMYMIDETGTQDEFCSFDKEITKLTFSDKSGRVLTFSKKK